MSAAELKRQKYRNRQRLTLPQKAQVERIVAKGTEIKYYDGANINAVAIPSSGDLQQLSTIPQGVTDVTRVGDSLFVKSINVRGCITTGDVTNLVRMVLFTWKPASTPTYTDVFAAGVDGTNVDIYSHYKHDLKNQYKIIKDKTFVVAGFGSTSSPYGPATQRYFKFNSTKMNKRLSYNAGSTTVGTNQIYYMSFSDSAATPNPVLSMKTRINFIDK